MMKHAMSGSSVRCIGLGVLASCVWLAITGPAWGGDASGSSALGKPTLVSGVENVEDMVTINPDWIIGSSYQIDGSPSHLYVFNTRTHAATDVLNAIKAAPDKAAFPDCPSAPDFSTLSTHGLDYYAAAHRLYVINHHQRESVEVFEVDTANAEHRPQLSWKGCAVLPPDALPDGVVGLAGNRMLVTSLWNPQDSDNLQRLAKGAPAGGIYRWSAAKGFSQLDPGIPISMPNGIVATRDGHTLWVNLWGGRQIARLDASGNGYKARTVALPYYPDNIRWSASHKHLLVGGQSPDYQVLEQCITGQGSCSNVTSQLNVLDPTSLRLHTLMPSGTYGGMSSGTGAVQVGNHLWLTSFHNDHIAITPLNPEYAESL